MHIHVIREWMDTDVYAGSFYDECSNASVVCIGVNACKGRQNIPTSGILKKNVFNNCTMTNSEVNKHPSTGTIYLSWLQEHADIERIDVFGMNWNMSPMEHSNYEGSIVRACCSKCIVHPTPSQSYT